MTIFRFSILMAIALALGVLAHQFFGPPSPVRRALQKSSHEVDDMNAPRPSVQIPKSSRVKNDSFALLRWEVLGGLDLKTGRLSAELQTSLTLPIRIPGYVVPLELNDERVEEFLLVPTAGACVHTPAPAANQMLLVRFHQARTPRREEGPVWVYGKLEVARTETEWGGVAFAFNAVNFAPYEGGYDE